MLLCTRRLELPEPIRLDHQLSRVFADRRPQSSIGLSVMKIRVDCYAGYRGEETPRRLEFDGREVDVVDVIDRWLAPDHRYFKVKGADGATYILRHDVDVGSWDLVMFSRNEGLP